MSLEKYRDVARMFNMSREEFDIFLRNYYDAFAFNEYLSRSDRYSNFDFDVICQLINFFDENEVSNETRKRVVISAPMIFSCGDFDSQLQLVYKDSMLEGIIINDSDGVLHPYRLKRNLRSITENGSMINNLVTSINDDYKKTYYVRVKDESSGKGMK